MTIERGTFENLIPSRFVSFTFPNHLPTNPYGSSLRVAVLDSPHQTPDPAQLAAMLVPIDREHDWIFSTESGHLQLLLNSPGISRLVLVGNPPQASDEVHSRPIHVDTAKFEESLIPLLLALSPESAFVDDLPQIPFLTYEDNVIRSVSVEKCIGSCVGEMLVEDVEIESHDGNFPEFRRRLRFKRMPNLIQTEIRIIPGSDNISFGKGEFLPDTSCLVHPYLPPMIASLSLIASHLHECVCLGRRPRVLCVGVGGGALLSFLQTQFEFDVYGVESDEMVVKVAKRYFGLIDDESLQIFVGDGIQFIKEFARKGSKENFVSGDSGDVVDSPFDVIMVDLDARDARNGLGAPPMEFISKQVLLATKVALHKLGLLVVNVIPVSKVFYDLLIGEFRKVFTEVHEIDVGNEENYVLIAALTPVSSVLRENENSIMKKLKMTIPKQYIDSIKKL